MSYQRILDDVIGDSPVSNINLDQVIHRQRRGIRIRRWTGAGLGAAALVAVTASTILLVPERNTGLEPAASATPNVPTEIGTPADRARLDNALTAAIKRAAPGATSTVLSRTAVYIRKSREIAPKLSLNGVEGYLAKADLTVDGQPGTLQFELDRDGRQMFTESLCPKEYCQLTMGARGEKIRQTQSGGARTGGPSGNGRVHNQTVEVLWPDGRRAQVLLTRSPVANSSGPDSLPLSLDQMTAIARDPEVLLAPVSPGGVSTPSADLSPHEPDGLVGGKPAEVARITTALFAALQREAPGVTGEQGHLPEQADSAWSHWPPQNNLPWSYQAAASGPGGYQSQGRIKLGTVTGRLTLEIEPKRPVPAGQATCGKPSKTFDCEDGTGPNGEVFRVSANIESLPDGKGHQVVRGTQFVEVQRQNGTWLRLELYCEQTGGNFTLTLDQMKAIAFDQAIVLPAAGTK